jgi:cathepsin C
MSPPSGLSVDCDNFQTATSMQVVLSYPNIATVAGRPDLPAGNWTTVATQGVDVWLNGTISFSFSAWDPATKASVCDKSIPGSMISLDGSQWRCFQMTKVSGEKLKHPVEDAKPIVRNNISPEERAIRAEKRAAQLLADPLRKTRTFKTDHKFLAKVNAAQSLFTVKHYPEYDGMSIGELERMRGLVVEDGDVAPLEEIAPSNSLHAPRLAAKDVPASFDWRNVSGVNFVSPVRSQGSCGSCYAFASAGMMEARIRVRSNNKQQPILSPQDVVSCSNYAQGCEGGFAYLVSQTRQQYTGPGWIGMRLVCLLFDFAHAVALLLFVSAWSRSAASTPATSAWRRRLAIPTLLRTAAARLLPLPAAILVAGSRCSTTTWAATSGRRPSS